MAENKVRLIELFAGVGSQAMALRNLKVPYESYKICEWWTSSFASYKQIHCPDDLTDYSKELSKEQIQDALYKLGISLDGKTPISENQIKRKSEKWLRDTYNNIKATRNLVNISQIHGADLNIVDTDKYTYLLTYSFPCQDLSLAGKQAGMDKGAGTRSGLLWEVERLLNETLELPQVLLMENVPAVCSGKNEKNFCTWKSFLESKGYTNFVSILNAADYGIAQNRKRAFMVSILGNMNYEFPKPVPLTKCLSDYLEPHVDEKYYVDNERSKELIHNLLTSGRLLSTNRPKQPKLLQIGCISGSKVWANPSSGRVYDQNGLAPTLNTCSGGGHEPYIIVAMRGRYTEDGNIKQQLEPQTSGLCNTLTCVQKDNMVLDCSNIPYRIRKLTPLEYWRLMGFSDDDYYAARPVSSDQALYAQAGNAIVVPVLEAIMRVIIDLFED